MAPVVPDPAAILSFPDQPSFEAWLAAHHASSRELWLKLHNVASGLRTVSYAEALDVALCWGWIDGQKKSFDATSWLQRFCPRTARSIWSRRNREHVERLIAEGRMRPEGLKQVEAAKADGRWGRAYAGASKMEPPTDLMAAIEADPAALATYRTLNAANRYALAFRTHNMKTAAGRQKKIAGFVEMLQRGEAPHPNGGGRK
jgi:uncharacterized protein YdeI (YjbR/CyaY-like superfamily)